MGAAENQRGVGLGMAKGRPKGSNPEKKNDNGANLGFEAKLWQAADALRNNMDAAEYKHVVLGLIFLKYISDAFEEQHAELDRRARPGRRPGRPRRVPRREHLLGAAGGALVAPPGQRQAADDRQAHRRRDGRDRARQPVAQGRAAQGLRPPGLDKQRLGELIDLIGNIGLGDKANRSKDILGRVYEYFLSQFASAEGKKGGQFYTPRCVVRVLVEMLAPYKGRVYDPCCGSGGMFVQSSKFVEAQRRQRHRGDDLASTARSRTTRRGGWPR